MSWLRHRLAPPGSRREALGRKIVQDALLTTRRRCRILLQRALQASRLSFSPLLSTSDRRYFPRLQSRGNVSGSPYDVLCLPIIRWDFRFQRPQQLMRRFAENGHRVFYLSDQFLLARPLAVTLIEPNIYDLRVPANAAAKPFHDAMDEGDVRRMAESVALLQDSVTLSQTVIVIQHPYWAPLAEELRSRYGWPIVYDCMDDHAGLRGQDGGISELEDRLVRTAELTVVTSDWLLARVSPLAHRTALVRNGVDYDHFLGCVLARAQGSDDHAEQHLDTNTHRTNEPVPLRHSSVTVTIGYYGAIAHWFDAELVAQLARLRPRWCFELIGNTFSSNLKPLQGLPNVHLLGEVPYADLPRRIAHWNCGIIPFLRNKLTEATNPVKVYEMLAAGMPTVAVNLPELRPIAAAGLIELADKAGEFSAKIEQALMTDSPAMVAGRQAFARENTWEKRYRDFAAAIDLLCGAGVPPVRENAGEMLGMQVGAARRCEAA